MTWFRVDDSLAHHAKVIAAGNAAMGLWVRAGAWSAQQLTDGHIPEHVAFTIGKRAQANVLVDCGLWSQVPGGFQFHEWNQCNPSADEVRQARAAKHEVKARAGRAGGIASGVARRKNNPAEEANAKQERSRVEAACFDSAVANAKQNEAPTRPDPTRTQEEQTLSSAAPRLLDLVPSPGPDPEPSSFEVWYDAYPLHKGRVDAEKAYAQALKKTTADVLLAGAWRYRAEVHGKDPSYIKHPGPWLRAGRWADEPTPVADRFGVGYGDADREGPSRVMSGTEWLTDPRSSA